MRLPRWLSKIRQRLVQPDLRDVLVLVLKPLICRQDPRIVAVASDEVLGGLDIPQLDLNDVPAIAGFIIEYCGLQGARHGAA